MIPQGPLNLPIDNFCLQTLSGFVSCGEVKNNKGGGKKGGKKENLLSFELLVVYKLPLAMAV